MKYVSIYIQPEAKKWNNRIVCHDPVFDTEVVGIMALKSLELKDYLGMVIGGPGPDIQVFINHLKKADQKYQLGKEDEVSVFEKIIKEAMSKRLKVCYLQTKDYLNKKEPSPIEVTSDVCWQDAYDGYLIAEKGSGTEPPNPSKKPKDFENCVWKLADVPISAIECEGIPFNKPEATFNENLYRSILAKDPSARNEEENKYHDMWSEAVFGSAYLLRWNPPPPIVTLVENEKYKLLNGKLRVQAAITKGRKTITSYIGVPRTVQTTAASWKSQGYKIHYFDSHQKAANFIESTPHDFIQLFPENLMNRSVYATKDGKIVGFIQFTTVGQNLVAIDTRVEEEHQRKGLASAMYDEAELRSGLKAKPSDNQTAEDKAFWEKRLAKDKSEKVDANLAVAGSTQDELIKSAAEFFQRTGWEPIKKGQSILVYDSDGVLMGQYHNSTKTGHIKSTKDVKSVDELFKRFGALKATGDFPESDANILRDFGYRIQKRDSGLGIIVKKVYNQ